MKFKESVEAILIVRSTVQEITYNGRRFSGKTFSGMAFEFDKSTMISQGEFFSSSKNMKFLFHEDNINLMLKCEFGKLYLSGKTSGFEELERLLFGREIS
ncbi:hypothetical protein [Marinobacter sp. es.042]|uniref:hypothetical protein n=1 Tax=Marinobacter sp. es.042 TaxID=1761794 RepID=UPI0012F7C3CF|nr:hypothetical protein [Marinobacter sp. es.042]